MKKALLVLFIHITFIVGYSYAQNTSYVKYMGQGKEFLNQSDFMTALERFDLAYEFAVTDGEKREARKWKNESRDKIKLQQADLKKALAKAEEMQLMVETAMFDKAVKERHSEWKGYNQLSVDKREEILAIVDTIDLSSNALLRIPKEIKECIHLKSLNLLNNNNIDWVDAFEKLKSCKLLSELRISIDDINKIDTANWKFITGLRLIDWNNRSLPKRILALKHLTYLDLSNLELASIQPEINIFSQLTYLNLSGNQLKKIPSEIGDLKNLKELNLAGNELKELPTEIQKLNRLERLELQYNELNLLQDEIGRLEGLKYIGLNDNKITELTKEIRNLKKLVELRLQNNQITIIPVEIGEMTELTRLNLMNNKLSQIPASLGSLKKLNYLNIRKNRINKLPEELGKLANLIEIDLAYNELKSFPKEIIQQKKLEQVDLSYNQIQEIPGDIEQMLQLQTIDISFNNINKVPEQLNQLSNLKELNLAGNKISNADTLSADLKGVSYTFDIEQVAQKEKLQAEMGIPSDPGKTKRLYSPNHGSKRKSTVAIVLHNTAGSYTSAISQNMNPKTAGSVHYIINRDGSITQLIGIDSVAWHSGNSKFENIKDFNQNSIGISLVNSGYLSQSGSNFLSYFGEIFESKDVIKATHKNETIPRYWQKYTQEQVDATYTLCKSLINTYPEIKYLLGHDEITNGRKLDPGPAFPIDLLREQLTMTKNLYKY